MRTHSNKCINAVKQEQRGHIHLVNKQASVKGRFHIPIFLNCSAFFHTSHTCLILQVRIDILTRKSHLPNVTDS